jgi:hypothetical protein
MELSAEEVRHLDEIMSEMKISRDQDSQVSGVVGRLSYADDVRQEHLERVRVWRSLYRQRELEHRVGSNLPSPLVHQAVEELTAQSFVALVPTPPVFLTTKNAEAIEKVESFQRFYLKQLETSGYRREIAKALREMGITGTMCLKYGKERVDLGGVSRWRDFYHSLRNEDYWVDPHAEDGWEPSFVIHLVMTRLSRIQALARDGVYLPEGLDHLNEFRSKVRQGYDQGSLLRGMGRDEKINLAHILSLPNPYDRVDPVDPLIPLLEYWGDLPLEGGKLQKNRVATLALGGIMLRNVENPNPWKPFLIHRYIESDVPPYGIGLAEVMEPSVVASMEVDNMMLDALDKKLDPMYIAGERLDLIQNHYSYEGGRVIQLGGPREEFDILPSPDIPPNAPLQKQIFDQRAKDAVGLKNIIEGKSQPPRKTAGEVAQLASNLSVVFQTKIASIADAISEMHQRQIVSWSRHVEPRDISEIQGPEAAETIKILDARRGFVELSNIIGVNADPERADIPALRGRIFSLLEFLAAFPEARATINLRRALEKGLEALGFHHEDPILLQPEAFEAYAFHTVAPEEEHRRLRAGIEISVLPGDDDADHINKHLAFANAFPDMKTMLYPHVREHHRQRMEKLRSSNREILQMAQAEGGVPPVPGGLGGVMAGGGT